MSEFSIEKPVDQCTFFPATETVVGREINKASRRRWILFRDHARDGTFTYRTAEAPPGIHWRGCLLADHEEGYRLR
jgi:hypothetical protein